MKKKFLVFVVTALLAFSLISCAKTDIPAEEDTSGDSTDENVNSSDSKAEEKVSFGTDGAKYLLAQNRLNATTLDDSTGIFEGEKVLLKLANKIKMSRQKLNNTAEDTVNVTDTSVEWDADQKDYSNSMSYFLNLTSSVEADAKRGANLIKHIKKYIRVINVWVKDGSKAYLLAVDNNSETLYEKSSSQTFICKRYTNEQGQDVYELYYNNSVGQSRMKYIEGALVEYYHSNHTTDFKHHFMADNKKGYWDVFGWLGEEKYTATIIKDDIIYDYIGVSGETNSPLLDVVSNDRKNDVITINDLNEIKIYPTAFEGFDKLVVEIQSPDDVGEANSNSSHKVEIVDGTYNVFGNADVNVILDDGTILKPGQLTDTVNYDRTTIQYQFLDNVYFNIIELRVDGSTIEDVFANLKDFLEQYNITCKYDFNQIIENVLVAQDEIKSNALYKTWNGVVINSKESMLKAAELENVKFDIYKEMINKAKEYETIDLADQDVVYTNAAFASIEASSKEKIKFDGERIIIDNLKFTVTNTVLLDKLETYSVSFGVVPKDNESDVIILSSKLDSFAYDGSDSYTISFSGEVELLDLEIGEYIPVFYLSTSDGIRISLVEPLVFDEVVDVNNKDDNHIITITKNEKNYLYIKIERNLEIYFEHLSNIKISYDELILLLGAQANIYGTVLPESAIEIYDDEAQAYKILGLEDEIISGKYRILYRVYFEEEYKDSYVFLDLIIEM